MFLEYLFLWYLEKSFAAVDKTFSTFVNMASHVSVLPTKSLSESNQNPNETVRNTEISDFFHNISNFTQKSMTYSS